MYFWLSLIIVLIADQLSKWVVIQNMAVGDSFPFIEGVLHLTYVQNRGAAFGILQGYSWIFLICALIVVFALIYYNLRNKILTGDQIIMGLIVGGATGNLIDRWQYNYVIDFFDLRWWPVFNIADMAIVCAGILLITKLIFLEKWGK